MPRFVDGNSFYIMVHTVSHSLGPDRATLTNVIVGAIYDHFWLVIVSPKAAALRLSKTSLLSSPVTSHCAKLERWDHFAKFGEPDQS
jgi:hypothetical protein